VLCLFFIAVSAQQGRFNNFEAAMRVPARGNRLRAMTLDSDLNHGRAQMPHTNDGTKARDVFITGLKNAHAMEKQALSMMAPQLERIENYPDVLQRMQQHKMETEGQVRRLEAVLERLGENPSGVKDTVMSAVGGLATLGHATAGDEILKNSFANFAFENYEIAAYNSLITLAEDAGLEEAIPPLQQNLEEEEDMANWLETHLPDVTHQYVMLREAGAEAKH
jgi:ferritin-like metal-binding protein YciE